VAATYEQRSDAHFVGSPISQKTGLPHSCMVLKVLDPRLRGDDKITCVDTFYESIKEDDLVKSASKPRGGNL